MFALQRAAGNQAVSGLVGRASLSVQRCGPVPCDCPPEEQAAAAQAPATPSVQRATSTDWAIKGKFPGAAGVKNTLFFDMDERIPDADELAKLPALASPPAQALIIKGTASEEGAPGLNATVVNARIKTVSARLAAAGHTGARTTEAKPLAGAGNIDYRRARSVEVRTTGATSAAPDCSLGPQPNDGGPAPNPFTTALARAHAMIATARGKLKAPDPDTDLLLTKLFGSSTVAAVVDSNLGQIDGQLSNMAPFAPNHGHQVVNNCDANCGGGATAYNQGDGPGAMMTLCPIYMSDPDLEQRAAVLVHEGSHGTVGLNTGDQAYQWQRLITQLPQHLALSNADSYTAFVRLVVSPGSISLGPAADVHAGGMTPAEQSAADRSVAWLEQWLIGTQGEIASCYGVAHESIAAKKWTNGFYEATMGLVAPTFKLTAPPAVPKDKDKVALAGIADRYQRMADALQSGPLTLEKVPGPATTWSSGPGTKVKLGKAFFALGAREQVETLLRKIVAATTNISAARRPRARS